MSKLKSTVALCFGLYFSIPVCFDVLQPRSVLAQSYNHVTYFDKYAWFPEVWVDSRFSQDEIERMLPGFGYFAALVSPGNTDFQSRYTGCLLKYYDSPWKRMSSAERALDRFIRDRDARGELIHGNIIQRLQRAFQIQVDGRRRRVYIDFYNQAPDAQGHLQLANTELGTASKSVDFHVNTNQTWISTRITRSPEGMKQLSGTLLHEFIHSLGYNHAVDIAPNFSNVEHNIVYESGWCMQRNMQDKPPGSIMLDGDNSVLFVD